MKRISVSKTIFILGVMFCMVFAFSTDTMAAGKYNAAKKDFYLFTPEGQSAIVSTDASISEGYTAYSNERIFDDRVYSLGATISASAIMQNPSIMVGKPVHKTSSTGTTVRSFSPWNTVSFITPVYDFFIGQGNKTSVTYVYNTNYVSGFSFTIYCSDAIVPTRAGSVFVSLGN